MLRAHCASTRESEGKTTENESGGTDSRSPFASVSIGKGKRVSRSEAARESGGEAVSE
jgi:hypothetical protein